MGFLRARTGHDFSSYKRATVMRRVARRMQVTRSASMSRLRAVPGREPRGGAGAVRRPADLGHLVLPRPRRLRGAGRQDVVGPIFDSAAEEGDPRLGGRLRHRRGGLQPGDPVPRGGGSGGRSRSPIQIFATDLDEGALGTAREGRYPASIEADVSEERLQRFFVREGAHYRIRKEVRDIVLFATHSVLKDPPFMRLDLVSCRNLLIYLERELQREVCALFAYGLKPHGYLFLGSAETTDANPDLFTPLNREARIYRARPQASRRLPVISAAARPATGPKALEQPPAPGAGGARPQPRRAALPALERAAPPSALVDQRLQRAAPVAERRPLPAAVGGSAQHRPRQPGAPGAAARSARRGAPRLRHRASRR